MILDSHPWKIELAQSADRLRRLASRKRLDERALVRLELLVLSALYTVSKLVESHLLSDAALDQHIQLSAYRYKRPLDAARSRTSLGQLYDLDHGKPVSHDLLFVCHQMLGNHTFSADIDAESHALTGIYVTSAHQRRVAVYRIEFSDLVALLERVANDKPEL